MTVHGIPTLLATSSADSTWQYGIPTLLLRWPTLLVLNLFNLSVLKSFINELRKGRHAAAKCCNCIHVVGWCQFLSLLLHYCGMHKRRHSKAKGGLKMTSSLQLWRNELLELLWGSFASAAVTMTNGGRKKHGSHHIPTDEQDMSLKAITSRRRLVWQNRLLNYSFQSVAKSTLSSPT